MTMRTPPTFSFHKVTSTTFPLLLLAFLSLSSAWAGAFNSGITSPLIHQQRSSRVPSSVDGSFIMKASPTTRDPALPSFLSLSTLLFLRGGQQDEDTVTSDETASLGTESINMQRRYGTGDAESSLSSDSGASVNVEMTNSQPIDVESADGSVTNPPPSVSSPLLSAMAPVSSLLHVAAAFYTQQLTLRPIFTKSLTAGIIFGLSDWCAQLIEREEPSEATESKDPLVFSRILSTFLVGLLFFGPAANAWYEMIFKVLPSTSLVSTLQKAALGQVFFGPVFTCVFFGAGMIQSGSFSLGAWLQKIRSDLPAVWVSGLGFWPVVDFISFKVVPMKWIPLFVNFCSFVWTIYLSLVANKGKSVEG